MTNTNALDDFKRQARKRLNQFNLSTASILQNLENSRNVVEGILDSVDNAIVVIDKDARIIKANSSLALLFGYCTEEVYGQSFYGILPEQVQSTVFKQQLEIAQKVEAIGLSSLKQKGKMPEFKAKIFELDVYSKEAAKPERREYIWSIKKLKSETGYQHMDLFIVVGQDVSELKESKRQIDATLESIPVGLVPLDDNGIISGAYSKYVETLLGVSELKGQSIYDFLATEIRPNVPPADIVSFFNQFEQEIELVTKSSTNAIVKVSAYPNTSKSGSTGAVLMFQNKTDMFHMRHKMQEVQKLVLIDSLTQIGNRRGFEVAMEREFSRAVRHKQEMAVLMLDIDHFKLFNDQYGHPKGDTVISGVAQAIQSTAKRKSDGVFRYGGEEFVVILPETSAEGAHLVCQAILESVRTLAIPHEKSKSSDIVTVSIGGRVSKPSEEKSITEAKFLQEADQALYYAKGHGRNSYHLYEESPQLAD